MVRVRRLVPATHKLCPRCRLLLERGEFNDIPQRPDGFSGICKTCERAYYRLRPPSKKEKKRV